ncbi:MAG: endonuclease/exonuclease/phosphatase family protein [Solirubrobacterales bacterium]|nr:endonuclease/exonuclease/phosphatase family protein [Solirubrobacterales bacterium]HMT04480.1 endonuclease/exonuclease/phosphatase family protein [Solirubrobacterales bacterium]
MQTTSIGHRARNRQGRLLIALAFALIGALAMTSMLAVSADAKSKKHKKNQNTAKVMTRNLYLGADLGPAIAATGPGDFISKNGQILRDVDTNNFPVRARGLADEIKSVSPDLVGLQEVALWRTGPADLNPPLTGNYTASTVHMDFLNELLSQINKGKKRYRVVNVQNEFDFEAPADYDNNPATGAATLGGEINGRLTMRDVILAKVSAGVKTKNLKAANYSTIYKPVISGIPVNVQRGWLSADVKVRKGKWFRFVNTHFEAFGEPTIREAQAKELIAPGGPLRSGSMPAVLVGDLNSDDDTVSGDDPLAYNALKQGGLVDRGTQKPMSCCVKSSILTADQGSVKDFDHYIDHIMTNRPKAVKTMKAGVTGRKAVNGYWNSDHAGVWSELKMP